MPEQFKFHIVIWMGSAEKEIQLLWWYNNMFLYWTVSYINGLVQERCNSIANEPELRLSCTNPSKCLGTDGK